MPGEQRQLRRFARAQFGRAAPEALAVIHRLAEPESLKRDVLHASDGDLECVMWLIGRVEKAQGRLELGVDEYGGADRTLLPARERLVLTRCYGHGRTMQQIGNELGIATAFVASVHRRGVMRLWLQQGGIGTRG